MNGAQLRALLWLRWRLTRNQWRRGGQLGAVIMLIAMILGLILAVIGGIGGLAAGGLGLSQASPRTVMFVWDGLTAVFLFFWMIGIVTELQRSEIIDLSRLLHLPISLRDVFLLNYAASHFSFSLAMTLPAMLGLTAGLVLGRGPAMLLLLPLVFGFFFMVTAWTYCLRGWLASLMVNKRRRRAVVIGVTMMFALLAQLPNLLIQTGIRGMDAPPKDPAEAEAWMARLKERENRTLAMIETAHRCVPPLWLPQGAKGLAEGRAWPALWGAFGMAAIGSLGLAWAYRGTVRFYQRGETKKPRPARPAVLVSRVEKKILVERSLPAVPEEAAAMALCTLRSMSRAPEVKMALVTNVLIFAVLSASLILRRAGGLPAGAGPFVASAAAAMTFFGLTQLMFNQFGFDRGGFRALVLLPTPRRLILLGKNLSLLPVALVVFMLYIGLAAVFAHLRPADVLAAGFEFGGAFLALSAMGNLASILVPYRISAGSLRPTKMKGTQVLLLFATNLLFPVVMLPVFLPAGLGLLAGQLGWLPAAAVTLPCAVLLAVLSALLYWRTLEPLGQLLQRRERRILEVVTQEVE